MANILLFELQHGDGTLYLSNAPAPLVGVPVTRDNQYRTYFPLVISSVGINSRIDSAIEIGNLSIANDGTLGDLYSLNFTNQTVTCYIGDESDTRDNFSVAFIARNGGITSSEIGIFNIDLIDGKYTINSDDVFSDLAAPVAFGSIYNAPCELLNAATQQYRVSQTDSSPVDAKDRGNNALTETGTSTSFTLSVAPSGVITADVNPATSTPASIITSLVTLANDSLDNSSLSVLPSYEMGVFYDSAPTPSTILNDIMQSLGGSWRRNLQGQIQVFINSLPAGSPSLEIADYNIEQNSLSIVSRQESVGTVRLKYRKNFSPMSQQELASALVIGDAEYQSLQREFSEVTAAADSSSDTVLEKTVFINSQSDAQTEAERLASIRSSARQIWSLTVVNIGEELQEGDTIRITSSFAGAVFSSGRLVNIISISKSLTMGVIDLEVWF